MFLRPMFVSVDDEKKGGGVELCLLVGKANSPNEM